MKMLKILGSSLMVLAFLIILAVAGIGLLMVDLGSPQRLIAWGLWIALLAVTVLAGVALVRGRGAS